MAGRDRRHGQGAPWQPALWRWLPVALVLSVLVAATLAWRLDLGPRWLGTGGPDPAEEPAAVAPPAGLELPPLTPPPVVAVAGDTADGRAARVRRALEPRLDDPDLGRHVVTAVGDLDGTGTLFTAGGVSDPAVPASLTKLLTAAAALELLGPDHVFTTSVVAGEGRRVVLVGGGDPLLARAADAEDWPEGADLRTLARHTAAALRQRDVRRVVLGYDDHLFSGPTESPRWEPDYVPDGVVSPITALWVDEGREAGSLSRVADPSLTAATEFAQLLERYGVRVLRQPAPATVLPDEEPLAEVTSAPLEDVVERVLLASDNEASEVLAHHVGLAVSGAGSFAAGSRGVLATMRDLGVRTRGAELYDGSGLSRANRLPATTLLDLLRLAAGEDRPDLRAVLTGLPVAGFSGSLTSRPGDVPPARRGQVRAKTGTLTGVSALAGVVTDRTGAAYAFVVMADRIDPADSLDARQALDDLAAALGACRCSA